MTYRSIAKELRACVDAMSKEPEWVRRRFLEAADEIDRLNTECEKYRETLAEVNSILSLVERPAAPDPLFHDHVKELGLSIGFGALMASAEAGWREALQKKGHSGGEYIAGPSRFLVTKTITLVRATLNLQGKKNLPSCGRSK